MPRQTDDTKKDRIIEAALAVFGEKGYGGTTIKDIAEMAEIAQGTIYTYFKDKDDLFSSAVEESWAEFNDGMEEILASPVPVEFKIMNLIDFGFNLFKKVHPLLRGMYSEANRKNLYGDKIDRICDQIYSLFADATQKGLVEASMDQDTAKFLIKIVVSGFMFQVSLVHPDEFDAEIETLKQKVQISLSDFFEMGHMYGKERKKETSD